MPLVHGYRPDGLELHTHVLTRHADDIFGQLYGASQAGCPEEDLRSVASFKWCVPSSFFFAEHVYLSIGVRYTLSVVVVSHLSLEALVWLDGTRLAHDLASLEIVTVRSSQKQTD